MLLSIRRVANALLLCGIGALAAGTLYGISQFCGEGGTNCLLASVGFVETPQLAIELPTTEASGSSQAILEATTPFWFVFFSVVQLTGVYVLLAGLIGLLVLECFELHYIRQVRQLLRQQLNATT
jgi:hypothetical protein